MRFWKMLVLLIWLPSVHAFSVSGTESLESVQESARKWIDLRLETSRMESDWAWQKDLLESMQETLEFRVKQLEEKESLLDAQMAAGKQKVERSQEQVTQLRAELTALEGHNQEVINELIKIRSFLPPRLSDSLELAYTSLSDPTLSTGEKLQLVVSILNRCTQFNGRITYSEEIARLGTNDKEKVLCVLYWGLSHAYALNKESGDAYLGKPNADGWTWIPDPSISSDVNHLIDIFHEDADPELVKVPVHINLSEF